MTINIQKNSSILSTPSRKMTIARLGRPGEFEGGGGSSLGQGAPGGFKLPEIKIPLPQPPTPRVRPINLPLRAAPDSNKSGAINGWPSWPILPFWPFGTKPQPKKPNTVPPVLPNRRTSGYVPFRQNSSLSKQKPPNYCRMSVVINEYVNFNPVSNSRNADFYRYAEGQKAVSVKVTVSSPFAEETMATAIIIGGDSGQGKPADLKKEAKGIAVAEALSIKNIKLENLTPAELERTVKNLPIDIEASGSCIIKGKRILPNVTSRTHIIFINGAVS